MIIEDDRNYRENLALLLELEGFETRQAGGAGDGFDTAREFPPDIILCDLLLPDGDGLELARRFKGSPDTAEIPIIVISGRGKEEEEVVQALEVVEEYIRKPCRAEEVKARVNSMLRLKRIQDQYIELNRNLEARIAAQTDHLQEANAYLQEEVRRRRKTEAEVQELNGRLLEVREDERGRMAVRLHDDLGQQIMALKWKLQQARQEGAMDLEYPALIDMIGNLTATTRRLAHDLSPAPHHPLGLASALDELLKNVPGHLNVEWRLDALTGYFPGDWDVNVYRIIQEAVQNAVKHAGAKTIRIDCVHEQDDRLRITITDDGRGFTPDAQVGGLGLRIMEQRALSLGGDFKVHSHPGSTRLEFSVQRGRAEQAS